MVQVDHRIGQLKRNGFLNFSFANCPTNFRRKGSTVKKFNTSVVLVFMLLSSTAAHAVEYVNEFLGEYFGGMLGVNNSKAVGAISAPGESTVAYIVQGGYIRRGYNLKLGPSVIGAGGYVDLHGYEKHSNGLAYGGHAYGLEVKLGFPIGHWLPYAKMGYGYSGATGDLRSVKQYGANKAAGAEYKLDPHWSAVVEYKINRFQSNSTTVENKTFLLGFNYYYDEPQAIVEEVPEVDYGAPLEVVPEAPPEFAPPI